MAWVGWVLGLLLVAGCTASPAPAPSVREPLDERPSTVMRIPHHDQRDLVRNLRAYLRTWADRGPVEAGRFLVASQRGGGEGPRISSGTLASYERSGREGCRLTVYATLVLRFETDPVAWSEGENGRFVSADLCRRGRLLLELATSP